jgi:hypothetical protein
MIDSIENLVLVPVSDVLFYEVPQLQRIALQEDQRALPRIGKHHRSSRLEVPAHRN